VEETGVERGQRARAMAPTSAIAVRSGLISERMPDAGPECAAPPYALHEPP